MLSHKAAYRVEVKVGVGVFAAIIADVSRGAGALTSSAADACVVVPTCGEVCQRWTGVPRHARSRGGGRSRQWTTTAASSGRCSTARRAASVRSGPPCVVRHATTAPPTRQAAAIAPSRLYPRVEQPLLLCRLPRRSCSPTLSSSSSPRRAFMSAPPPWAIACVEQ